MPPPPPLLPSLHMPLPHTPTYALRCTIITSQSLMQEWTFSDFCNGRESYYLLKLKILHKIQGQIDKHHIFHAEGGDVESSHLRIESLLEVSSRAALSSGVPFVTHSAIAFSDSRSNQYLIKPRIFQKVQFTLSSWSSVVFSALLYIDVLLYCFQLPFFQSNWTWLFAFWRFSVALRWPFTNGYLPGGSAVLLLVDEFRWAFISCGCLIFYRCRCRCRRFCSELCHERTNT